MESNVEPILDAEARKRVTGRILSYWRTVPVQSFDSHMRAEICACVRGLSAIDPQWRAAIGGDAAAAVAIALEMRPILQVCLTVDIAMTILLACAFDNAAAALVLCDSLKRIPLPRYARTALLTSWMIYHSKLALRAAPWRRMRLF